jgi:hypothetical protein
MEVAAEPYDGDAADLDYLSWITTVGVGRAMGRIVPLGVRPW